jgi:hypothetical protein
MEIWPVSMNGDPVWREMTFELSDVEICLNENLSSNLEIARKSSGAKTDQTRSVGG